MQNINTMKESSYANVCRVCLTEQEELQSIFVRDESTGLDIHLAEMIMAYASVQITLGDGLPEQICLSCAKLVVKMYIFKKQCEESDTYLRERLGKSPLLKIQNDPNDVDFTQKFDVDEILLKSKMCVFFNNLEENKKSDESYDYENVKVLKDSNIELSQSVIYECEICYKRFNVLELYNNHKKIHEKSKLYFCEACPTMFSKMESLQKHKIIHEVKVEEKSNKESNIPLLETVDEDLNQLPHAPTFQDFE